MASPGPIFCTENERLLTEFTQVVARQNELCAAQLAAVLNGEDFPLEHEISRAIYRRREIKRAIMVHRREHG